MRLKTAERLFQHKNPKKKKTAKKCLHFLKKDFIKAKS